MDSTSVFSLLFFIVGVYIGMALMACLISASRADDVLEHENLVGTSRDASE